MSNCRYIDISSSYRNRNQYPNPFDFKVEWTGTSRNSDSNMFLDPVATGIGFESHPVTAAVDDIPNNRTTFVIPTGNTTNEYYTGLYVVIVDANGFVAGPVRKVLDYVGGGTTEVLVSPVFTNTENAMVLNSAHAIFSVSPPLTCGQSQYRITPGNSATNTATSLTLDTTTPNISSYSYPESYIGTVVHFVDSNGKPESRVITDHTGATVVWAEPVLNVPAATDYYFTRPNIGGVLSPGLFTDAAGTTLFPPGIGDTYAYLDLSAITDDASVYVGLYIFFVDNNGIATDSPQKVTAYDRRTRLVTWENGLTVGSHTDNYFFRRDLPIYPASSPYTVTTSASTTSSVTVPAITNPDRFVGSMLHIGAGDLTRNITSITTGGTVINFEPALPTAPTPPNLGVAIFDRSYIVTEGVSGDQTNHWVQIHSDFDTAGTTQLGNVPVRVLNTSSRISQVSSLANSASNSDGYCISSACKDNHAPLNWVGSTLGMQNPRCHSLDLCEFIIPGNQTLKNFPGGTIGSYPYIYMEFEVEDQPSTGVLVSNNPNVTKALFKIPVANDYTTTFFRLGSCTSPVVKFRPNDTFHIRLLKPNGQVLEWSTDDRLSPFIPNPALQLSLTIRACPCNETLI